MDNVVTAEKATLYGDTTIVHCYGYAAGSDVPVADKAYTTAGTLSATSTTKVPGECAALLRWSTAARTTKNHPIYLFNYYHAVRYHAAGDCDTLDSGMQTSFPIYAAAWIAGFSDGTLTLVRAGPNGANATASTIETWITHRDFPK